MNALAVTYGIFIWAAATVIVYFIGGALFEGGLGAILILYALTVPAIWGLLQAFWRVTQAFPEDRLRTGVLIATPGLLLDAFVMLGQPVVFADFTDIATRSFAGWLLWAYGVTCVIALRAQPARQP